MAEKNIRFTFRGVPLGSTDLTRSKHRRASDCHYTILEGLRHHHYLLCQWQYEGEHGRRAASGDRHGFHEGHGGQDGGRRAPSSDVSAPGVASRSRVCTPHPQGGAAAPSRPRVPTTSAVDPRAKENHDAR